MDASGAPLFRMRGIAGSLPIDVDSAASPSGHLVRQDLLAGLHFCMIHLEWWADAIADIANGPLMQN